MISHKADAEALQQCPSKTLNDAGFSDHDLLFTRPNEHAGAAEPGLPPDAASQQRRVPAVLPARRRAAGTGPLLGKLDAGICRDSLCDQV